MSNVTEDEAEVARWLADILIADAARHGGPVATIRGLCRTLRMLRMVVRLVTAERDRCAWSLNAVVSQRKLASHVRVKPATMQGWIEAGAKLADTDSLHPDLAGDQLGGELVEGGAVPPPHPVAELVPVVPQAVDPLHAVAALPVEPDLFDGPR